MSDSSNVVASYSFVSNDGNNADLKVEKKLCQEVKSRIIEATFEDQNLELTF